MGPGDRQSGRAAARERGGLPAVVIEGAAFRRGPRVMAAVPISTAGLARPTLTATTWSRASSHGVQNMGTYRPRQPPIAWSSAWQGVGGAGGYLHYRSTSAARQDDAVRESARLPAVPRLRGPAEAAAASTRWAWRALAGRRNVVARARRLLVTEEAESDRGIDRHGIFEPEPRFGESHGHVALEEFNMPMRVTAITHRRDAIIPSYISQVTPSESSVIKRVAYEPLFLTHLRNDLGIRGAKRVALHEPLTALLRVTIVVMEKGIRARKCGARSTAPPTSRATAARSRSPSTTTSTPTTPTPSSGRWRIA